MSCDPVLPPGPGPRTAGGASLGDSALRYLSAPSPASSTTALERGTLVGRAREAILGLIDENGLCTGDALPSVAALAERFACSRTVVREALSALAALGIVEIANGRAARIRQPDSSLLRFSLSRTIRESEGDPFAALMDVRAPLEIRAAELAARRLGPGSEDVERDRDREVLAGHLAQMRTALGDPDLYPRLDLRLHSEIARLAGSPALRGVLDAVGAPLFRAMRDLRSAREEQGLIGREHEEHARIVEAILSGDTAAAAAAMAHHMSAVEHLDAAAHPPRI